MENRKVTRAETISMWLKLILHSMSSAEKMQVHIALDRPHMSEKRRGELRD